MTEAPCKGCDERTMDCHGVCERFKKWEKLHKEELEDKREFEAKRRRYYVPWKNR